MRPLILKSEKVSLGGVPSRKTFKKAGSGSTSGALRGRSLTPLISLFQRKRRSFMRK